jgi:hypothetical protein
MKSVPVKRRLIIFSILATFTLLLACGSFQQEATGQISAVNSSDLSSLNSSQMQKISAKSMTLGKYLIEVQSSQLKQGLLRQDGGGSDTPFTADSLAHNFEQIVFFNEYNTNSHNPDLPGKLRRWQAPVRVGIEFGASVSTKQRNHDRNNVIKYAKRLSQITGHQISVNNKPNFLVFFVNEDERSTTVEKIATELLNVTTTDLIAISKLPEDAYCAVATYASSSQPNVYTSAVAVIRAENPSLLRLSCIHEEIAQALGLANDSPQARPSIFNDDDEFALLTNHDEILLKMLYDQRLQSGMSLSEAKSIIRALANEATQEPS